MRKDGVVVLNQGAKILARRLFAHKMPAPTSDTLRRVCLVSGVVLLLAVMAAELALSARQQSQTFDEGGHIYAGYAYWKSFDFGVNPEHPPLVKLVATIPLLRLPLRAPTPADVDFKTMETNAGKLLLYRNDAKTILWRTRIAAAVFTIGLALTVFLLARSMWGDGPAFLALVLLVFEPNFLAHGALVTTDIGVTLGFVLGVGTFYLYLKKPGALRLVAAGLAAGLCIGAKHSGILLFPMLIALAIVELLSKHDPVTGKLPQGIARSVLFQAGSIAAIGAISYVVLWSLYGFRYAARPSGMPALKPAFAVFAKHMSPLGSAIVLQFAHWHLLPESYLYGIVDVATLGPLPSVVFGKFYPVAQWFYFPSVFIMKSTLAFLALCALVVLSKAFSKWQLRTEALFLAIPPAIYLFVAMSSSVNYGVRHLLPVYPFLIILVSYAAWRLANWSRKLAVLVAVLVVCHAGSSLRAFPNYIPYANEAWGGSSKTYELLTDSNVDWGQGLIALKQYIDQHQIKSCWIAYYTSTIVDVSYYGIPCHVLPPPYTAAIPMQAPVVPPQVDGPVFIGAMVLSQPYFRPDSPNPYLPFQHKTPSALIADSILVFDGQVDLSQVSAMTHEILAMQLMSEHKLDQALAESDMAVGVAPTRSIAHVTRSSVLLAMGRNAEALVEIKRANSLQDSIVLSP